MDPVQSQLNRFPEHQHDELVELLKCAPLVQKLTGKRPDRSSFHRWEHKGRAGVHLRTMFADGARYTSLRWLIEFFLESAAAKIRNAKTKKTTPKKAKKRAVYPKKETARSNKSEQAGQSVPVTTKSGVTHES